MDKSILLCLCFHVLTLAIYLYGTFYDFMYVDLPTHKTYGGRLKYLTGWNKVCFPYVIDPMHLLPFISFSLLTENIIAGNVLI